MTLGMICWRINLKNRSYEILHNNIFKSYKWFYKTPKFSTIDMNFSDEEVKKKIKELGPWRHNIDLGNGIKTREDDLPEYNPEGRWKKLIGKMFPEDMTGLTVLDVGCNTGFYSIKVKKRGAERVVALDDAEKNIRQAIFLSEWFKAKLEIIKQDLLEYVLTTNEQFDYVIFSRVFYHLRYPNLILDRLGQMVNKKLIFLTETIGDNKVLNPKDDYSIDEKDELLHPLYPKMFFIEKKYVGDKTNWWVTNESCNEALIRAAGLKVVEHPRFGVYVCEPKEKTKPLIKNDKTLYLPNVQKFLDK